jgi:hypothetical protein
MSMGYSEKVNKVYTLMGDLGVSLYDLELMGFIENRGDDVVVPVDEAFNLLKADGFDLVGDRHAAEHYYQTTADHVSDALEKAGLLCDHYECADGCGLDVTHEGPCLDKPGGRIVCNCR